MTRANTDDDHIYEEPLPCESLAASKLDFEENEYVISTNTKVFFNESGSIISIILMPIFFFRLMPFLPKRCIRLRS